MHDASIAELVRTNHDMIIGRFEQMLDRLEATLNDPIHRSDDAAFKVLKGGIRGLPQTNAKLDAVCPLAVPIFASE
jgi:hypothetical protein